MHLLISPNLASFGTNSAAFRYINTTISLQSLFFFTQFSRSFHAKTLLVSVFISNREPYDDRFTLLMRRTGTRSYDEKSSGGQMIMAESVVLWVTDAANYSSDPYL